MKRLCLVLVALVSLVGFGCGKYEEPQPFCATPVTQVLFDRGTLLYPVDADGDLLDDNGPMFFVDATGAFLVPPAAAKRLVSPPLEGSLIDEPTIPLWDLLAKWYSDADGAATSMLQTVKRDDNNVLTVEIPPTIRTKAESFRAIPVYRIVRTSKTRMEVQEIDRAVESPTAAIGTPPTLPDMD